MSELVQQGQQAQLPQHILAEYSQHGNNEAMGELLPSDLGIPFVKMVHGTSKEAKPNWGGNNEQPMVQGTMFLSDTHQIVPVGTPFIVLCRRVSYIKWIGRPNDGKMEFTTLDPNDRRIKACDGLAFRKDPNNPAITLPPLVTTYYNFYVLTPLNMMTPYVLSFYRTSMPRGRELVRAIFTGTNGNKAKPYVLKFKFGTPHWEQDGDQSWPQFTFQADGVPAEPTLKIAKEMYPVAHMMASAGATAGDAEVVAAAPATIETAGSMELDEKSLKQASAVVVPDAAPAQQFVQQPANKAAQPVQHVQQAPAQQATQQAVASPLPNMPIQPAAPATTQLW